jgi:hypothetical protein
MPKVAFKCRCLIAGSEIIDIKQYFILSFFLILCSSTVFSYTIVDVNTKSACPFGYVVQNITRSSLKADCVDINTLVNLSTLNNSIINLTANLNDYAKLNSSNQPFYDSSNKDSINTESRIMYDANENALCTWHNGLGTGFDCVTLSQNGNTVCDRSGNCNGTTGNDTLQTVTNRRNTTTQQISIMNNLGINRTNITHQITIKPSGTKYDGIFMYSPAVYGGIDTYPGFFDTGLDPYNHVKLAPRGFGFSVDYTNLSTAYQTGFGITSAGNRPTAMIVAKNNDLYPAILIESGRFGIATSTPAFPMDVRGDVRFTSDMQNIYETKFNIKTVGYSEGGSNVGNGRIEVYASKGGVGADVSKGAFGYYGGDNTSSSSTGSAWAWKSNGLLGNTTIGTSNAQMVFNQIGYLGINTTAPTSVLHINGNASISNTLKVGNINFTNIPGSGNYLCINSTSGYLFRNTSCP